MAMSTPGLDSGSDSDSVFGSDSYSEIDLDSDL